MSATPKRGGGASATGGAGEGAPAEDADLGTEALAKLRASRRVSWLLDECVRIPGTKVRFGLDPVLGIVPYGGETVATVIGALILGDAGRRGLPVKTMLRMGGNMLLNAGVGAIPVVGDLFSFWFKSNSRNYGLLVNFVESDRGDDAPGGWGPLLLIGSVVALVFLINLVSWIFFALAVSWLVRQLQ